jgi:hypothetical protein
MTVPRILRTPLRTRLLLGLGGALVGMLVFSLMTDGRSTRERAAAWAADHATVLPQTLEDLAAYPLDYQRAILKALPAEQKSQLWRTQLRQLLSDRPNLSVDQRAFVEYAIDLASPEAFAAENPPDLCERIAGLFPNPDDRRYFRQVASAATPEFGWRPTFVTLAEGVRSSLVARARQEDCTCRGLGACECPLLDACVNADCETNEDCGCIFALECNRICEFILNRPTR